jgi:hypothetical protein
MEKRIQLWLDEEFDYSLCDTVADRRHSQPAYTPDAFGISTALTGGGK